MYNIENTYTNYDELVSKVEESVIKNRINQLANEMTSCGDGLFF